MTRRRTNAERFTRQSEAANVIRNVLAALRTLVGGRGKTFDVSSYAPELNNWLSIVDRVEGRATLRF